MNIPYDNGKRIGKIRIENFVGGVWVGPDFGKKGTFTYNGNTE